MNLVYASQTCSITSSEGFIYQLRWGEPWDADDPLVKARPSFFSKKPVMLRTSSGRGFVQVEQATAAPGEKRAR